MSLRMNAAWLPLALRAAMIVALITGPVTIAPVHGGAALAAAKLGPPPAKRLKRPKRGSLEYRLSWGVSSIRADRAYADGVSGAGVTVALIDTGIDAGPADLFETISPASTDLIADRRGGSANAEHGEQTASLLAARLDGARTMGVAYGATLLAIRADIDGSCTVQCAVRASDLGRGIDYALDHGASIIGIPLVGPNRLKDIEPALQRAAAAGAVIVAAAGNNGSASPAWPARYAADPRFSSSILVAGASTIKGDLARWSSKARLTEDRYIAAPGENVVVDCDEKYCRLASGTSYSVAYVAGALALVMAGHPGVSATDAAVILLKSARDKAPKGQDSDSGVGILDVARAMQIAREELEEARS